MLDLSEVTVRFGATTALHGFDLQVAPGEIVGLVGHNGAGKTTFARVVAGLVAPAGGTVTVAGTTPRRARPAIGHAPQELALYPTATARDNLLLFAGLYGVARGEARRRIRRLAADLSLDDVLDRRVRDLSGGQQRRVQAATAMIHRPRVLLLDEPTVGADPVTRDALLGTVRATAAAGAAVVYTTHYLPELETLDATLAVVDRGRVIARGDRRTLLADVPGHAVVTFDDREVSITDTDPAAAVISAIVDGPHAGRHLRSIELHPPTLDDLYRHLVAPCT
ncbi:ABC transporter [Frankia sp. CcI49]|nr:ABC transporter [Frankia sp. CcI49]